MLISYTVKLTVFNNITNSSVIFNKNFESEITANDNVLYDNYHVLHSSIYVLDLFLQEVEDYCEAEQITTNNIVIDEYEIVTLTENVEVFFENPVDINAFTLTPDIKCYVYPKEQPLPVPTLHGKAYDSNTIVWTWDESDEQYAHYLIYEIDDYESEDDKVKIVATIPMGAKYYIETGLEPNTAYTRQLINYTDTQTSLPSAEVTSVTETVNPQISLDKYFIEREHDWSITDAEREVVKENLTAFKSGIGDLNDLKVYKQMDKDFYEKFKAYFTLTGEYTQREKRYNQVGFNYKICLEAKETITEQEGEVTFKLDAYPWQEMYRSEYLWATKPVTVYAKVCAYVDLFKKTEKYNTVKKVVEWTETTVVEAVAKPTTIMISIDLSSSMRLPKDGTDKETGLAKPTLGRLEKVKEAAIVFIDKIEEQITSLKTYNADNRQLDYIITGYATTAHSVYCANGDKAKEVIRNLKCGVLDSAFNSKTYPKETTIDGDDIGNGHGVIDGVKLRNRTNWGDGFTDGSSLVPSGKEIVCMLFFTDGYPNSPYYYKGDYEGDIPDEETRYENMYKDIEDSIKNCPAEKIFVVFGNKVSGFNDDGTTYKDTYIETCQNKIKDCARPDESTPSIAESKGYVGYEYAKGKIIECIELEMDKKENNVDDENTVAGAFVSGINFILPGSIEETLQTGDIEIAVPYTSVEYKTVYLESEPIAFTFNENITPVAYSDKTHRAEIVSKLDLTRMSDRSILDLLTEAKENSEEWQSGWTDNPHAVDSDGNVTGDIFKNVHIKDTYSFGAEDIPNAYFRQYNYGMMGTINVTSDIPKLSTSTNADDEYVATDSSYLYISGFTNGIIYDTTRSNHVIVNAYKKPQDTMFRRADLATTLQNRINPNVTYGSSGINSNNISKEVLVEELPDPSYMQVFGNGIDQDMIVKIDESWSSPVLNYRFNLVDPEAYTPYHEILPDAYKDSSDKHLIRLTVYYAKNVEINSDGINDNYYSLFDYENPVQSPLVFEYGLNAYWNSSQGIYENDGHWITQYVHFYARKMKKTQDYYDEYPNENMDSMYGLVNGRYRSDNLSGKQDLFVDTPEFNIPTTVLAEHADTIKIYIKITEKYPEDALVSYKWDHETAPGSGYTQVNGDYVTFSSESLTYKDIKYTKTLATLETEEIELFNQDPYEKVQTITKPEGDIYDNYFIEVTTDNGDVIATRYPTRIDFGNSDTYLLPVTYRGVINATSKWSPRIHNGYYYVNQHERYLYSDFDVEADFEKTIETQYQNTTVFVNFNVSLEKEAGPTENYSITKDTMAELLQDEEHFEWVAGQGLTLKPIISGLKYRHYQTKTWYSPVLLFNNELTQAGPLKLDYVNTDGSNTGLNLFIRSFNLEEGKWTDWTSFTNNSTPATLSCGYQLKADISATESHTEYDSEDYLCCYLDWCDYLDENLSKNIVTITDHITTGIAEGDGTVFSKILQYGCPTGLELDIYSSDKNVVLSVAYSNSINDLILENAQWHPYTSANLNLKYKYYRFKITIPEKEKVYWIRLKTRTLESEVVLPYIKSISITGVYVPVSTTANFMKLETFTIPKDGIYHEVVPRIGDYITSEVTSRGFTVEEIKNISITSMNPDIYLLYDNTLSYVDLLESSIEAATSEATIDKISYLPYIKAVDNQITIKGTPQQYCPITIEDENGTPLKQIYNIDPATMMLTEIHTMQVRENYVELKRNDYELVTFKVWVNDTEVTDYSIVNHLLMFKNFLNIDDEIVVTYKIKNSFYASIDRKYNTTVITIYTGENNTDKKFRVMFETNKQNNKLVAKNLSLNPVYRTDYSGFIYLTEEHNTPYKINIWCNPRRIKSGGKDNVDIQIEVLDIIGNPIIGKQVDIDCNLGTITYEEQETDMNGIIHCVYTSSHTTGTDVITAKVLLDDMTNLQESIEIISY